MKKPKKPKWILKLYNRSFSKSRSLEPATRTFSCRKITKSKFWKTKWKNKLRQVKTHLPVNRSKQFQLFKATLDKSKLEKLSTPTQKKLSYPASKSDLCSLGQIYPQLMVPRSRLKNRQSGKMPKPPKPHSWILLHFLAQENKNLRNAPLRKKFHSNWHPSQKKLKNLSDQVSQWSEICLLRWFKRIATSPNRINLS